MLSTVFRSQVKVMLRMSAPVSGSDLGGANSFFSLDKRKKQVTLVDPSTCNGGGSAAPEDRRVAVAAPKMFAFDAIFSQDDSQVSTPNDFLSRFHSIPGPGIHYTCSGFKTITESINVRNLRENER